MIYPARHNHLMCHQLVLISVFTSLCLLLFGFLPSFVHIVCFSAFRGLRSSSSLPSSALAVGKMASFFADVSQLKHTLPLLRGQEVEALLEGQALLGELVVGGEASCFDMEWVVVQGRGREGGRE